MTNDISIEEALRSALKLHHEGHHSAAFELYRRVLEVVPEHPDALHYLGVLAFQQNHDDDAVLLMTRSIELAPEHAGFRANLGNVFFTNERFDAAENCYREALALDSDHVDSLNNLGVLLKGRKRYEESERALRKVVDLEPDFIEGRNNLAGLYMAMGRVHEAIDETCQALIRDPKAARSKELLTTAYCRVKRFDEAARVCREWLAEEPANAWARHHLAACTGEGVPERASDAYVRSEFDEFSESFDAKLAVLEYQAPTLIADAVMSVVGPAPRKVRALDAGCGTGLCGVRLREVSEVLIGVDLSPGMLRKARRRDLYDDLIESELTAYLAEHAEEYDLIVSADTLVYFGALEDVIDRASDALRGGGYFCFTLEALDGGESSSYVLRHHGRYAHTNRYVDATIAGAGLSTIRFDSVELRKEAGLAVAGWLVLARKAI